MIQKNKIYRLLLLALIINQVTFSENYTSPDENCLNFQKDTLNWITVHDTISDLFVLTFKYPSRLKLADQIDNCICIGTKIKNDELNKGMESTNTRQWSICMQDTSDISVDSLISSWKSNFKGKVIEKRDNILVDNSPAICVTLKSNKMNDSYYKLIYLKKGQTLFEIVNIYEKENKDLELFYSNLKIEVITKPRH